MRDARLNHHRDPLPTRVDGLPELPPAYVAAIEGALAGLAAVDVQLDGRARALIDGHLRLMIAWNASINLTAIVDPAEMARLHVTDSLAALPVLREGPHASLIDIGAGAGFPGLPLAAAIPSMHVTLVESVGKKANFLQVVAHATGLAERVAVRTRRAEALAPGRWDVVTARAVGTLADLVELGLPLLAPGGRLIAWKRGDLDAELAAARRAASALGGSDPRWYPHAEAVAHAADLVGHGVVVVVKTAATPPGFPRDPAGRKRLPW